MLASSICCPCTLHVCPTDVPNVLNTLAFSPGMLPRLWRWLCYGVGLPLEVPAGAVAGMHVVALAGGYSGLRASQARVMGLFCRSDMRTGGMLPACMHPWAVAYRGVSGYAC